MSYHYKNEEMDMVRQLLVALEVGTRKEDKKLTDAVLARHNIGRGGAMTARQLVENLSRDILDGPGFELFFLEVAQSVRPFALMLQEVYGFLSAHATNAERRSSVIRVSSKGAAQAFNFDLSNFPKETLETITRIKGRKEILKLTPGAKRDLTGKTGNLWNRSNCWRGINPCWDGDFYDDGFYRALSYANTILSRGGEGRRTVEEAIAGC